MTAPLADCPAMAPLLAAFARGTKRSRLRQLVVVCPNGHTLVEVFPTAEGPHAVWQHYLVWERVNGQTVRTRRLEWRAAPLVELRDADLGVAEFAGWLDGFTTCRCTDQARVNGRQLTEWLASGTRREILHL